ncbi:odorant receptor coreceptor [Sitodiplosis mosellana]|uniref:odorant receptor coreceptor n=1 Tax=Sitodiplosis mosellana TaxID=263140 RepID=UPI0024443ACD|nr:odorant receptor coreceptor [Sitodiplosis mosellana]
MQVQQKQFTGLVADLMPNIKLMRFLGHFLHKLSNGPSFLNTLYSFMHLILMLLQFVCIIVNLALNTSEVNELTANTVTALHFMHTITKFSYLAMNNKNFYRTFNIWNQSNSHPLFAESDARYHSIALAKMRKNFYMITTLTMATVTAWTVITFFGESVKGVFDKETNETYYVEVPRLPIKSYYPWNAMSGIPYIGTFIFQVYYLTFSMLACNLTDVLFCSWLCFACEQLCHLKGILKPLMELSASLDTYRPNSAALFRSLSANSKSELVNNDELDQEENGNVFVPKAEWGGTFKVPPNLANPNGLSKKQEIMVRSAIKYWVERHKHVVRLVSAIGDTYGAALLLHMLTSTICLTLLAYQATKIDGVNVYALSTIGYLVYALGQVFHFCIFGNRLIEESSSVMEAAYCCHWYDGSEEAKTFVQIVCQQCQKAMTISGAKFFTVSLDLFASVLGAVVTYFMVLVQLK